MIELISTTYIWFNNKLLLCYNICRSLLDSQYMFNLCPIPALYSEIPAFYAKAPDLYAKTSPFYADIFPFGFHFSGNIRGQSPISCLWSIANYGALVMSWQGRRAGSRLCQKQLRECASRIILARNVFFQSKAQYWVPVCIPLPQGTGKSSSTDNAGVQICYHNCDLAVDPSTYVWNGFLKFFCHELTQIREYD